VEGEEITMAQSSECQLTEQFLNHPDEESFSDLFRTFLPQLYAFFRKRGHEEGTAEDLTQEVMLAVYRKAGQIRDHKLFRAWLFTVARNTAHRHFVESTRQLPTVDVTDLNELPAAPNQSTFGATFEFRDWIKVLDSRERETMTLRFVEEWEYHEIAAAQSVPIGTVQWRVYNSTKKLAQHLSPRRETARKAA
jgi:RNA polymerase sigma-70 factor (ECF subfamily)